MIGFFIGGICGIWLMCLLQINRDNELKKRINKAIEYMKYNATSNYFDENMNMFRREMDLLDILGGDVDD